MNRFGIKPSKFSENFTLDRTVFNVDDAVANAMNSNDYSQFTIQLTAPGGNANPHNVEFFSPMRSAATITEASIGEPYTAAFATATGNLTYTFGLDTVVVSCLEIPYRALFDFLQTTKLMLGLLKYSCTNANQANRQVQIIQKGVFGSQTFNQFVPSSYRKASDNTSGLFYDIPLGLQVDNTIAFQHIVNPGETVAFRLFVPNVELPSNY